MFVLISKYLLRNKSERKSNVEALIGKEAIVDKDIDNSILKKGYIKVGPDYFTAVSERDEKIKEGTIVIIKKIEGNTAIVSIKK